MEAEKTDDVWRRRTEVSLQALRTEMDSTKAIVYDLAKEVGELRGIASKMELMSKKLDHFERLLEESLDELGDGLGEMFNLGAKVFGKRKR